MRFRTLYYVGLILLASVGNGLAQAPMPSTGGTDGVAEQRAEVKASVEDAKADIKISAATREQIQALRLALRAKLAAMRH
jgi:hypothetical protein